MFSKHSDNGFILVAVSMDDFLAAATSKELNDQFYETLSEYKVKRLGTPTTSTGAFDTQPPDCTYHSNATSNNWPNTSKWKKQYRKPHHSQKVPASIRHTPTKRKIPA